MRELIKWIFAALMLCSIHQASAQSSELEVECSWGKIGATLAQAEGGSDTVVVIIAGSGSTDRDGNSLAAGLRSSSYALLSQELVSEGFAVLRYDKRGIGQSVIPMEDVPNLVFEDYVDDVEQIVRVLRDRGFERVILAGHSEGGLIALVVSDRQRVVVDGVVLLAAAGYPLDSILLTQLGAQLIPANISMMYRAEAIIKRLKRGESVAEGEIPKELLSLFHPVVQPFIISQMQYNPAELIARVEIPLLIVSGGHDIQVSLANGEALVAAQPRAEHRVFESMTHVLKDADTTDRMEQLYSVYSTSNHPLTEGLTAAIAEFINKH